MIVIAVHTDAVREESMFVQAMAIVSQDRRERVRSCKCADDRARSLCAGLALGACLHRVGFPTDIPVIRDVHGKPRFSHDSPWYFSLSHSGRYGICALSEAPVGVDIQECRPIRTETLANRYFTADESEYLMSLSPEKRDMMFYRLWTAKESVLKAEGVGLSGLSQVPIVCGETLEAPTPWRLQEYTLPDHAVTVCGTEPFPEELMVISSCDSVLLR